MNAPLLSVVELSASRGDTLVLRDISFDAARGAFIGLVGANGAGKTTLLRALAGIAAPTSGEVHLDGAQITQLSMQQRARALAYLPQLREVHWNMTVEAVVALGRFAYGDPLALSDDDRRAVEEALMKTGVDALRVRRASALSGGEQARMHLARALAGETPVLLADEPTASLDPKHQLAVMRLLREKAQSGLVIAALHDLRLAAKFCTRIIILHDGGVLADGAPENVLTDENLQRAFDVPRTELFA
jgi:iron complex transport system ATP-binding protein